MTNRTRQFLKIVSGEQQGIAAAAARGVLRVVEIPYTWGVRWRNDRYDRGYLPVTNVGVPVISVGNLTLGGTGKTPMVKWIARWMQVNQRKVAIVSRGYGAKAGTQNDEALELQQALPNVPHVQNPNRIEAAQQAIDRYEADVILADDGFQHRRLHRDLNLVLVDAVSPFGFDHVFPRGTLREPLDSLQRADIVCITRCDMVDEEMRNSIRQRIAENAPLASICMAAHSPSGLIDSAGNTFDLMELRRAKVAAFCGIGNPAGFSHTLAEAGCKIVVWREFPDHYAYTATDALDLCAWAQANNAERLVCTHKDLVKLSPLYEGSMPISAITIEMQWHKGQSILENALNRVLERADQNEA